MATNAAYVPVEGDEVFGSDGEKLGKVVAADANYIVVEKGWFFPTDYYIPTNAIASYADGHATLTVTKDAALNQGWDVAPDLTATNDVTYRETPITAEETGYATTSDAVVTGQYATDTPNLAADTAIGLASEPVVDSTAYATRGDAVAATGTSAADETLTVPVYAEELVATTRTHEVGGARIEKTVESVDQTLDVPVTEERLRVVRRTVDRDVTAADAEGVFEDVIVDVPITVADVEVSTRAHVAEEIVLQREEVQRTEQVHGTVRREHVEVTEAAPGALDEDVTTTDTNRI